MVPRRNNSFAYVSSGRDSFVEMLWNNLSRGPVTSFRICSFVCVCVCTDKEIVVLWQRVKNGPLHARIYTGKFLYFFFYYSHCLQLIC